MCTKNTLRHRRTYSFYHASDGSLLDFFVFVDFVTSVMENLCKNGKIGSSPSILRVRSFRMDQEKRKEIAHALMAVSM